MDHFQQHGTVALQTRLTSCEPGLGLTMARSMSNSARKTVSFIAGISIKVLTVDVSSVVGAPWRCGVLTTEGGTAGIGLGHQLGSVQDSNSPEWGGSSSPAKTEPLQIDFREDCEDAV